MKDSSLNRWLWLVGLAAAVCIFLAFGPLGSGSPGENASGVSVAHWFNNHVNQQWASVYLVGVALFLLLVYVTQLRSVLVQSGGQRLWPNVVFASGILLVAGFFVLGSFEVSIILASHNHQFGVVHFINFYTTNAELLFLGGMAFLTLSTGLAILLNRGVAPLPKLLGWYSILVAVVGVAGKFSFIAFLFGFPIWILATGIVIARKQSRGSLAGGDGPGAGAAVSAAPAAQPVAA